MNYSYIDEDKDEGQEFVGYRFGYDNRFVIMDISGKYADIYDSVSARWHFKYNLLDLGNPASKEFQSYIKRFKVDCEVSF